MKTLNIPSIGRLPIEHTFYQYGIDKILFVCLDNSGTRYICSNCKLGELWVVSKISIEDLISLIDNKLMLPKAFNNIVAALQWDGNTMSEIEYNIDMLPREGSYLDLSDKYTLEYKSFLEKLIGR